MRTENRKQRVRYVLRDVAHLEDMVPGRGTPRVYVEVSVAVLHTNQAILGHLGLGQQGIIRPVVFHP